MRNWKEYTVHKDLSVREVMKKINDLAGRGLYVVDEKSKLLGSVTDGDIRRAIIRGVELHSEISLAMKPEVIKVSDGTTDIKIMTMLEKFKIQSVPVVDKSNTLVGIFSIEPFSEQDDIQVVLLAGGMGTRLGKITQDLPKPMVKVAGEPILERIIKRLISQGFSQFHISVNYKAEMIEDYFQNGHHLGCNISYLKESKRLGTAGPLSLLKGNGKPVVIMNGDLLTHVDIRHLLSYHIDHSAKVTMCTRSYDVQVPFGVINLNEGFVQSFEEKPNYTFNVNAGIYVIDPSVLDFIPCDEYYDMSSLLNKLLEVEEKSIACFPIVEGWIDVGRIDDLNHAQVLYSSDNPEDGGL